MKCWLESVVRYQSALWVLEFSYKVFSISNNTTMKYDVHFILELDLQSLLVGVDGIFSWSICPVFNQNFILWFQNSRMYFIIQPMQVLVLLCLCVTPVFLFPSYRIILSIFLYPSMTCRLGWAALPFLSTIALMLALLSSHSNNLHYRGSKSWRWDHSLLQGFLFLFVL